MTSQPRPDWKATIRGRLLAGFTLLFVLGLTVTSVAAVVLIDTFIQDRSHDKLVDDAHRIENLVESGPQIINSQQFETMLGPPLGILGLTAGDDILFAIGTAKAHEYELARLATAAGAGEVVTTQEGILGVLVTTPGMQVTYEDQAPRDVAHLVLVSDPTIDSATAFAFLASIAGIGLAGVVLLVALAVVVLRIGLRPLAQMAQAADEIAGGSRDRRLLLSHRGAETDVLAAAVNRAFDAQVQAEDRARSFAADASHELRTPLATISGWLELYRQGALRGDDVETAVVHMENEVGRMRLLVDELGLLARLDADRPLDAELLDLAALADSVAEDARIVDTDLDITVTTPPGGVLVRGDAARLQQVLRNLVGNAVQHNAPGTRVRLDLSQHGGEALIEVTDDGAGIAPADLPRLFDRFWRAEGSRSRDYGGSGLGLAIVQAIIHSHGGRVSARSRVGEGTTVSLHLPLASADDATAPAPADD